MRVSILISKNNMLSNNYTKKFNKMQVLEKERKQRIFNDKQRLIGIDTMALENQVKERKFHEEQQRMYEDIFKKNLNFLSVQAIQEEELIKHVAHKNSEYQRQIENLLLAKEQKFRNSKMNQEALSNIPSDDYYNYFNTSSR